MTDPDHDLLLQINERLIALTAKVERELEARDQALALQAREIERRLEGLNGEAARINAAANKSVNVDVYEADKKATALALATAKEAADRTQGGSSGRQALVLGVFAAGGFVAAIVAVIVAVTS